MIFRLLAFLALLLPAFAWAESKAGTTKATASVNFVIIIPKMCWTLPDGSRKCNYPDPGMQKSTTPATPTSGPIVTWSSP